MSQASAPPPPIAPSTTAPPFLPPQSVINITQNTDPASEFIKGVKQLPDDFPTLKGDGKWQEWKKSMNITVKAQLVSEVLDGTYVPSIDETTLFEHKQTYMLAVFKKNINFKGKEYSC